MKDYSLAWVQRLVLPVAHCLVSSHRSALCGRVTITRGRVLAMLLACEASTALAQPPAIPQAVPLPSSRYSVYYEYEVTAPCFFFPGSPHLDLGETPVAYDTESEVPVHLDTYWHAHETEPPAQAGVALNSSGFGVVYLAEQQAPVRRRVALKILKPGMDTREVIARFEAERQALALMDHPNIARVLDPGATEQGRPFGGAPARCVGLQVWPQPHLNGGTFR